MGHRGGLRKDAAHADQVLRVVGRCLAEIGQSVVSGSVAAIVSAEQGKERGVAADADQASVSGKIVAGVDDRSVQKDRAQRAFSSASSLSEEVDAVTAKKALCA